MTLGVGKIIDVNKNKFRKKIKISWAMNTKLWIGPCDFVRYWWTRQSEM